MGKLIVNADTMLEEKVKNGLTRESKVYLGAARDQASAKVVNVAKVSGLDAQGAEVEGDAIPFTVKSKGWKNSAERFNLMRDLKTLQNQAEAERVANGAPSPTTLATYFAKLFIDVQRQADEMPDYSSRIYTVISREDAQEVTYLRDLIPYSGKEKIISGENDSVPLLEAFLANEVSITLYLKAFGWKNSIKNLLFNPIDQLQRITQAAATINVDSRNNDIIGHIVGLTTASGFKAKQQQAADSTGSTYDLKVYNTFRKALKTLATCTHPLTGQALYKLGAFQGGAKILCSPVDAWTIERAILGELSSAGGLLQVASALPISEIIAYGGGIMDGWTWGKETLSLPGVTAGKAYVFLPNQLGGFVLDKRPQTLEVGSGSVLELSTEERAWYRVNGLYHNWFTGDAESGANNGKGCIVEITLPVDNNS